MAQNFHSNLPKDFEGFLHEVKSVVQARQQALNESIQQEQKKCIEGKKEQDYLKCQTQLAKKLEKNEALFQFKMIYWRETSVQCFKTQEQKGAGTDQCKADSKKLLETIFDSFKI
ncbi:unnamed protein product [Paramecium pentaurelia]|uniref:Uncharacterized protein n=1 Tax=Paramecium pentaurelia TaxID=43138 RepID=A0A8S1WC13_9CILI|nr:unnamed protein product [Paramecium pentaurelia]